MRSQISQSPLCAHVDDPMSSVDVFSLGLPHCAEKEVRLLLGNVQQSVLCSREKRIAFSNPATVEKSVSGKKIHALLALAESVLLPT